MADFIAVTGNVGSVDELRTVGDTVVLNFTTASNRRFTTKSGEKREETMWVRWSVWGNFAKGIAPYLAKGKVVAVRGTLKIDPETGGPSTWDNNGETRTRFEADVEKLEMFGGGQAQEEKSNDIPF